MSAIHADDGHDPHAGESYQSRVTVDLDAKEYARFEFDQQATQTYYNLDHIADAVDVAVSSSGKGLHLVGWFEDRLEFHVEVALRRQLGDDSRRVHMDIERWKNGLYTQVMFDEKSNRSGEKVRGFDDVHDALDYIEQQRLDDLGADRLRRVVNYGHSSDPELARRADL